MVSVKSCVLFPTFRTFLSSQEYNSSCVQQSDPQNGVRNGAEKAAKEVRERA
jgi:hypothetical protein